jgi:hypothetical protein
MKTRSLVERSLRALRLAAVAIVAAGAAAYSPFFSGYMGPGTPTGDAVGTAASWVVANLAAAWDRTLTVLPAVTSAVTSPAAAAPATSGAAGAPMVLTPPKPATSASATPPRAATTTPAPAAGSPRPPATAAAPTAPRPAASAPASVGAIPPASAPSSSGNPPPNLSQGELALVVTLVRNTLVALNQANLTGNYTVLRDLGAPGFREANTASRLSEIFASLRALNLDLSPVVLFDPRLSVVKVNDNGMLNIAGSLTTQPVLTFEMLYQRIQNTWQLFGVSVATEPALAAAPKPGDASAPPTPASAPAATPPATRGTTPPPRP